MMDHRSKKYITLAIITMRITIALTLFVCTIVVIEVFQPSIISDLLSTRKQLQPVAKLYWAPPDIREVTDQTKADQIAYGRELIAHTSRYLGPNGSVASVSNGMNCQNCHLDAGTKTFGNNYSAVVSTYPKFRARSGSVENIEKRVNDCFERSLNGTTLDTSSREMKAIVEYISFIGSNVTRGEAPEGAGLKSIAYLSRPADPGKGKLLYSKHCESCHEKNGGGVMKPDSMEYQFPPLWGEHSFNNGAGIYRLSNFAKFIYGNMPLGASHDNPILTEEEAWDISAFVNSQTRPQKDLSGDWPVVKAKPFDHPYGPYADKFTEAEHKYGPFKPIQDYHARKN